MWLPEDQMGVPLKEGPQGSSLAWYPYHAWATCMVTMEFPILRNEVAATNWNRASLWKMKVRDP